MRPGRAGAPWKTRARQAAGDVLFRAGGSPSRASGLAILMYHAVTARTIHDRMQMSVSADLFASHMACLRSLDIDIVPLREGVKRVGQAVGDRLAVSVTFDDGFAGVYEHALDALKTYRIPATVFVTTSWVGKAAFPEGDPSLGRPLTWGEIATLAGEGGCRIGSHTHTHPRLTTVGDTALLEELRRSRDLIAANVGAAPREFAYPFGSYESFSARTQEALAAEQFALGCTTVWGRNFPNGDPLELKRLRMSWCDSPRELRKSLAGCYDWYRIVQRLQAHGKAEPPAALAC